MMKQVHTPPIRVLHIIPGFGGGISSHVRNILHGLNSTEVQISVAGFTGYPDDFAAEVREKGGEVFQLKNVRIQNIFECINEYRMILKSGKFETVHIHMGASQALYFSFIAYLCGIKRRIVHAHIADQQESNTKGVELRKRINQILTVMFATDLASCSKLSSAFRYGKKYIKNNRVMHIPNSINAKQYFMPLSGLEKEKYYQEFQIKTGQIVIGHVGFFGYQKNHPFMFRIAKAMKEKGIDFVWLFVGTGYNFEEYVSMAREMGLEDCVRFLGRRADVCSLYKIMNVTVLASHFEGLPTVTIETQAAGTPTVISNSISDETDMGLKMIERVSLDMDIDNWINAIICKAQMEVPNSDERKKNITERAFTTETAASLYAHFLRKEILVYNLGTRLNINNEKRGEEWKR